MTKNGDLIPEARADKNGKTTVRWVRSLTSGPAGNQKLPAPTLVEHPDIDLEQLRTEVAKTIGFREDLKNLGADTLGMLLDTYRADKRSTNDLRQWVSEFGSWLNGSFGESYLREILTYRSAFYSDSDPKFIEFAVGGLGGYKRMPRLDDYSQADPEMKRFIHGLLSITDHLHADWFDTDEDSVPETINDPELVDLIFDHPDKVELIRSVIVERKTQDVGVIRAVLDSGTVALGEGAL